MAGSDVRFTTRDGDTLDGYLTGADDGFLVSVPDIFWRQTPGPTADIGVALDRGAGHNFAMPRKVGDAAAAAQESRARVLRCFRSIGA